MLCCVIEFLKIVMCYIICTQIILNMYNCTLLQTSFNSEDYTKDCKNLIFKLGEHWPHGGFSLAFLKSLWCKRQNV